MAWVVISQGPASLAGALYAGSSDGYFPELVSRRYVRWGNVLRLLGMIQEARPDHYTITVVEVD